MKHNLPSGSYFEGDMVNGTFEGKGRFVFFNGDVYEGEFSQDMFEGNGVYKYKSGSVYKGVFSKDLFHGIGTLYFEDGTIEKGKFHQDKRVGKFFSVDQNQKYSEIMYHNDKFVRQTDIEESNISEEKKPH